MYIGKRHPMDSVPQNLAALKRPALQKLCKQLGLKANGKNVDMVRSLEEYSVKHSQQTVAESSCTEQPSPEHLPEVAEESHEPQKDEATQVCEAERDGEEGERGEAGEKSVDGGEVEEPAKRGSKGRGRGRNAKPRRRKDGRGRGKVSKEIDTPTETEGKTQPAGLSQEDQLTDQSLTPDTRQEGGEGETPLINPLTDPEKENVPLTTQSTGEEDDTAMDCLSPLSADTKENDGPKRQRRDTFSVSPRHDTGETSAEPTLPLSPPLPLDVVTPASGTRKRKRTHSISPRSSLLLSGGIVMDTGVMAAVSKVTKESEALQGETGVEIPSFESESGQSTTLEIMALLDQRVAERKADPGYIPPLLDGEVRVGSRIPVSKTMSKFNRAHNKNFKNMQSIVEFSEKKKRRIEALQKVSTPAPPAKKQKVDPKTPSTAKNTSFRKSTVTKPRHPQMPPAKTPLSKASSCSQLSSTAVTKTKTATNGLPKNTDSVTTTKPKPTNTVRFDPQLTMKDAHFNFGDKTATMSGTKKTTVKKGAAPAMKTPKSATKREPFNFTAKGSNVHVKWQPKDRQAQFKQHTGKLPNFLHTIY